MSDEFGPVRRLFTHQLSTGRDLGAAYSVTRDGTTVVDLWGGYADAGQTRTWDADTLVNVWSITKTMTAMVALLVADRGDLCFDRPVGYYWPEFAAAGKAEVTVAHLMSHSSGVSGWREPITVDDLYDLEKASALLAAQEPFWKPGTASGYHAVSQGHLVGEVLRRVTGQGIGALFRTEFAEPLGADFHIGLDPAHEHRVADLVSAQADAPVSAGPDNDVKRSVANPPIPFAVAHTRAWRGAEVPAANGHGNARSVARLLSVLACGGEVDGRRYLSEAGCRRALEVQVEGVDLVLGIPLRWGLGFAVASGMMPNANSIYWGGRGGALAIVDFDARTTLAYAMNLMSATTTGDLRGFGLAMATWEALNQL